MCVCVSPHFPCVPAVRLSLFQTPSFLFVWPHCASVKMYDVDRGVVMEPMQGKLPHLNLILGTPSNFAFLG